MAKKSKTLSLRRAVGPNAYRDWGRKGVAKSLHEVMATLHQSPLRQVDWEGRIVRCRSVDTVHGMTGLHLICYTPKDPISVVQHTLGALGMAPPPEDTDYLDGELMLLIAGDDVITCRCGITEAALTAYLEGLSFASGDAAAAVRTVLLKRADMEKLKLLAEKEVKSIHFKSIASAAALRVDAEACSPRQRIGKKLFSEVGALLDLTPEAQDLDGLFAEVVLKVDGRRSSGLEELQLATLAREVIESSGDDPAFAIVMEDGQEIRGDDVVIAKKVSVPAYAKSVAYTDILGEMVEFYRELTAAR